MRKNDHHLEFDEDSKTTRCNNESSRNNMLIKYKFYYNV